MASDYTGDADAVQAPSPAPGPGVDPIISLPSDTTDDMDTASIAQGFKCLADFVSWLTKQAIGLPYGDGSDGDVTLDGTTPYSGFSSLAFGHPNYTLTRDVFAHNLTINTGVALFPVGFRIFVSGELTINGTGVIDCSGGGGSDSPGGAQGLAYTPVGMLGGGSNGANGSNTTGAAGSNRINSFGGAGGNGGEGLSPGGAGGTVSSPSAASGNPHAYPGGAVGGIVGSNGIVWFNGGAGGGAGGGGGGSNNGGGGGAGGGVMVIVARRMILANATGLTTAGGKGGNGDGTTTGGGGGGGGGDLVLVCPRITVTTGTLNAATVCAGGVAGGSSASTPVAQAGAVGNLYQFTGL